MTKTIRGFVLLEGITFMVAAFIHFGVPYADMNTESRHRRERDCSRALYRADSEFGSSPPRVSRPLAEVSRCSFLRNG